MGHQSVPDISNMANSRLHPAVVWAQRNDKLYVTINLEDCIEPEIKLEEDKLHFLAKGGPEKKEYEVNIEFFKPINPEESKFTVFPRNVPMLIVKKEDGPYWPRLLKDTTKQHWLKTDFAKWRDEDDSDTEAGGEDQNFEDMTKQMGSFNAGGAGVPGMGGMGEMGDMAPPDDEEDSDDEDLPDLPDLE